MRRPSIQRRFPLLTVAALMLVLAFLEPRFGHGQSSLLLNFSNLPLLLGEGSPSNLVLAIDNSGSTDFEVSVSANGGALYWNPGGTLPCASTGFSGCAADPGGNVDATASSSPASATLNVNPSDSGGAIGFYRYTYLFPNGSDGAGSRLYGDGSGAVASSHFAVPPIPAYGWSRSPTWNKAYFDPGKTYAPWENHDRSRRDPAAITATPSDPALPASITLDLGSDLAADRPIPTSTACASIAAAPVADWGFRVFSGMSLPAGTCLLAMRTTCSGVTGPTACASIDPPAPSGPIAGTCLNRGTSAVACVQPAWTRLASATAVGSEAVAGDPNSLIGNNTTQFIRYFPASFWLPRGAPSPYASFRPASVLTAGVAPDGSAMDGYEIKPANFTNTGEYDAAIQNFANWYAYHRKRLLALKAGIAATFNKLASPLRLQGFAIGSPTTDLANGNTPGSSMYESRNAADLQAFYRQFIALRPGGSTPIREALRYLGTQYRRTDRAAPINSVCQKNFALLLGDSSANPLAGSVPAYSGLNAGNVDGATEAEYQAWGAGKAPYRDSSTTSGQVAYSMADEALYDYAGPLRNDSSPSLNFNGQQAVPVSPACAGPSRAPELDCNPRLHLQVHALLLNTLGLAYRGSASAVTDAYATPPAWPDAAALARPGPAQIDDLFHAAVNGRGRLLDAVTPDQIANHLQSLISELSAQGGSAGGIALNAGSIGTGSALYAARFDSGDWSGQLQRLPLSASGPSGGRLQGAPDWDAQPLLDRAEPGSRSILSYNPASHAGVPFRWSQLAADQQSLLSVDPTTGTPDAYGAARVDYLRGMRGQEAPDARPRFRRRGHLLGDIVGSSPFFVGAPNGAYGAYNDADYSAFRARHAGRRPMVYVGANDGMLHGFNADTAAKGGGTELLAYVPAKAYGDIDGSRSAPLLAGLSSSLYPHSFIVDGSPSVADAKVRGQWRSVLVSGMGQGGQGLFALDVTDPASFSEANADRVVLWEFTDADDPDLGYTYSQPAIVKMANGRWAAVIGNGYNNTATAGGADASYSGTPSNPRTSAAAAGRPALFIIMLDGPSGSSASGSRWVPGTDYFKIYAGATASAAPNGLASPAAVDIGGDGLVDYIYAGDLLGNLWRFNVTSSAGSSWALGYSGNPLFVAHDTTGTTQAITERPEVGFNLNAPNPSAPARPQLTVYFGTGRFIDQADASAAGQRTQTFYAVFDRFDDLGSSARSAPKIPATRDLNSSAPASYSMVRQQILGELTASGAPCSDPANCYRITTANPVGNDNQGWYLDLVNTATPANRGERQITNPVLNNGRIIFTTLLPAAGTCSGGGGGYLMELSANGGARLSTAPIDVNGNGRIDRDGSDQLSFTEHGVTALYAVSGVGSAVGIPSMPMIARVSDSSAHKYFGGSTGEVGGIVEGNAERSGRITWREITP